MRDVLDLVPLGRPGYGRDDRTGTPPAAVVATPRLAPVLDPATREIFAVEPAPAAIVDQISQRPGPSAERTDPILEEIERLRQSQDLLAATVEEQRREIERLRTLSQAASRPIPAAPTLADRATTALSWARAKWQEVLQAAAPQAQRAWRAARSSDSWRAVIAALAVSFMILIVALVRRMRSRATGAGPQVAKFLALAAPDLVHREAAADGPAVEPEFLSRVVRCFSVAQRKTWSKNLSAADHAPRDLSVALANDDIEIAEPLLSSGSSLTDDDLIAVIERRSSLHQRAIARRRDLTTAVADALVGTQKVEVISALLRNRRARISEKTMESIVDASRHVASYREPIARRPDLSPRLAWRAYHWLPDGLRRQIDQKFSVSRRPRATAATPTVAASDSSAAKAAPRSANQTPIEPSAEVTITPQRLVESLRQGNTAQFESQLRALTGLGNDRLQAILRDPGGDDLAQLCCALGIDRLVFASVFILTRKLGPAPRRAQPHEFARVMATFDEASADDARRTLKAWRQQTANPIDSAA